MYFIANSEDIDGVSAIGTVNLENGAMTFTSNLPYYEYTYSNTTGRVEILKRVVDDKGKVSKSAIFTGVAVSGKREVLTVVHYGDTPVQSYLVKQ